MQRAAGNSRYYEQYRTAGTISRTPINKSAVRYENTKVYRNTSPFGANVKPKVYRKKKTNPVARIFAMIILALVGIYVMPFGLKNVFFPVINYNLNPEIRADYKGIISPTSDYIGSETFLNGGILPDKVEEGQMTDLYLTDEIKGLKSGLQKLASGYAKIQPSVFVWEYDSGKYVDINGDKHFSAASIIKIPVLLETFRAIEANDLSIDEKMVLTEYYRSEGSGKMKYHQSGNTYTIDKLARMMIEQSDNTATNMLIAAVGGMPRVNSAMKSWGINNTHIQNWLPDLEGTNYTTTKDLAKMLYNIENSNFISPKSKGYIFDYMGHVENNRLIQAGLGEGAKFVHKTGDIGGTLGDSGIVTTPNGKKYIVSIIANRPYNSPAGKDFIVKASNMIYNYIAFGNY